jgi:hypothetical protein
VCPLFTRVRGRGILGSSEGLKVKSGHDYMEARPPHASLWLALRFQKILEVLQVGPELPPARHL